MTLQEKLDWFWAVGELPGSVFDDLNDRKPEIPWHNRRRQARRLPRSLRKQQESLEHEESSIDLRRRS